LKIPPFHGQAGLPESGDILIFKNTKIDAMTSIRMTVMKKPLQKIAVENADAERLG